MIGEKRLKADPALNKAGFFKGVRLGIAVREVGGQDQHAFYNAKHQANHDDPANR